MADSHNKDRPDDDELKGATGGEGKISMFDF